MLPSSGPPQTQQETSQSQPGCSNCPYPIETDIFWTNGRSGSSGTAARVRSSLACPMCICLPMCWCRSVWSTSTEQVLDNTIRSDPKHRAGRETLSNYECGPPKFQPNKCRNASYPWSPAPSWHPGCEPNSQSYPALCTLKPHSLGANIFSLSDACSLLPSKPPGLRIWKIL